MKIRDLSQAGDALYCQALVTIEYMVLLPFLILARFTVKLVIHLTSNLNMTVSMYNYQMTLEISFNRYTNL